MGNSQTEKVHNASENHSQDVPKHSTRNKKTLENQLKDQTRPTKKKGIEQEMLFNKHLSDGDFDSLPSSTTLEEPTITPLDVVASSYNGWQSDYDRLLTAGYGLRTDNSIRFYLQGGMVRKDPRIVKDSQNQINNTRKIARQGFNRDPKVVRQGVNQVSNIARQSFDQNPKIVKQKFSNDATLVRRSFDQDQNIVRQNVEKAENIITGEAIWRL